MKIAFTITRIPDCLYYKGEGKAIKDTYIVEVPNNIIPLAVLGAAKDKDAKRVGQGITDISVIQEAMEV